EVAFPHAAVNLAMHFEKSGDAFFLMALATAPHSQLTFFPIAFATAALHFPGPKLLQSELISWASLSAVSQLLTCTTQSALSRAFDRAPWRGLNHFEKSAAPPLADLASSPHRQLTSLPFAFTTPASHFDWASAVPAAPAANSTVTAISSLRILLTLL